MLANQMKLAKFYPEYISNHIWIGGYNTLMVCKDDGLYRFTESFPDRYYITAIHEDMDSCIWVLSWHDGLRVWKKQPDNQYVYQGHKLHQREGTALEVVGRDLWIGTSVGLFRYDIPTGNCRKYGFAEGLVSEDVIALKAFRGELWVGTTGGISTIPLKPETEEVAVKPKIKVHTIRINQRDTTSQSHFRLAYDQNDLSIELQAFAFKSGKNYTFEHRMWGIDSSWNVSPSGTGAINYYDLKAGKYVFEARVKDIEGRYSTPTPPVEFEIIPPYWEQLWFQVLGLISGVILIFWSCWLYFRRRQKRAEMTQKLLEAELTSLKLKMNPHFLFNIMNSIVDFLHRKDTQAAREYLVKIAHLMRSVLEATDQPYVFLDEEVQ
ncbi:MAG: histidine kinase, partial [Bacteroidota bacterium]